MAQKRLTKKQLEKKQKEAQEAFERLVNRHGLQHAKIAHYESQLGSLRIGVGKNAQGMMCAATKWFYPELDQEGKIFHYAWVNEYAPTDTEEMVHAHALEYGEHFAREMLSGRVSK